MPRKVNPGSIKVGKGLAPEGTVEDNSLRYPERDADPLRVHIHDPSRAHMASSIGIVDANDCYVSDEVEGALQELCGHTGAGRLNGLISGGTFAELVIANGTGPVALAGISSTLTLVTPTEVLMNGTVFEASGLTVELPAPADTYYIYLSTDPTSPTYRSLEASVAPPPEVETAAGVEDILFAKVVHDGTNITSWQDGRFFVRNLDRKVTYSSRQGENVDAWSEGCFATLEAFFLWMEEYGDGGTSEEEKGTVLIRGTHNLTQTLTVPTDHLQFIGDGEAILTSKSKGAGPLVLVDGKREITFRNISFISGEAGTDGLHLDNGCREINVENCMFNRGSGFTFGAQVKILESVASAYTTIAFRDCLFSTIGSADNQYGIDLASSTGGQGGVQITNCYFTGLPSSASHAFDTAAIHLGTASDAVNVTVTNCEISGLKYGIWSQDGTNADPLSDFKVTENLIENCIICVEIGGEYSEGVLISGNAIYVNATAALYGINVPNHTRNLRILNNRLWYTGDDQGRVAINVLHGPGTFARQTVISGNTIVGFYAVDNYGIVVAKTHGVTVANNGLFNSTILLSENEGASVTGNTLEMDNHLDADPVGIHVLGCSDTAVSANSITHRVPGSPVLATAIRVETAANEPNSRRVNVADNTIRGGVAHGIQLKRDAGPLQQITLTGNNIDGFKSDNAEPTMVGILMSGGDNGVPDQIVVDSNIVTRCFDGIEVRGFSDSFRISNLNLTNNVITFCAHDQANPPPANPSWGSMGSFGIGLYYTENTVVSGNTIDHIGQVIDDSANPIGFSDPVYSQGVLLMDAVDIGINDNTITDIQGPNKIAGILCTADSSGTNDVYDVRVIGNQIECPTADYGVRFHGSSTNNAITFADVIITSNSIQGGKGADQVVVGIQLSAGTTADGSLGANFSRFVISDNDILFSGRGVHLFTNSKGSATQITVRDNTLTSESDNSTGIYCQGNVDTASNLSLTWSGLTFSGNTIRAAKGFNSFANASGPSGGTGFFTYQDIIVRDNSFVQSFPFTSGTGVGIGIGFFFLGDGPSFRYNAFGNPSASSTMLNNAVGRITVEGNSVNCFQIDAATNEGRSAAFSADFGELTAVDDLRVDNNDFQALGVPTTVAGSPFSSAVRFVGAPPTATPGTLRRHSFSGNKVHLPTIGTTLTDHPGAVIYSLTGWGAEGVQISDNTLSSYNTGALEVGAGLLFASNAAGYAGRVFSGVAISRNNSFGAIAVALADMDADNISIDSNKVELPSAIGTWNQSVYFNHDGGSVVDLVKITGNQIDGGRDGIHVMIDDANVQQLRITDNDIHDVGLDGTGDGIELRFGISAAPASAIGTLIQGNTVRDAEGIGIEIDSTRYVLTNLSVDGNTVDRAQGQAIKLDVGGETNNAGRNVVGVSVNDNCLTNCGDDRSLAVLEIDAGATSGADPTINGLSVSGNQILGCGGNDGATAILVNLQPTQWLFASNIRVDNNCIFGGQFAAIPSLDDLVGTGIDLILPVFDTVSVCGNEIQFKGYAAAGTASFGIRVDLDDDGTTLNINRNTIRDFGGAASTDRTAIFIDTPTTGSVSYLSISVDDNSVEGLRDAVLPDTDRGIMIVDRGSTSDTGTWKNMSISRNQISDCLYGIEIASGGSGTRRSDLWNFSADDNKIMDWSYGGFWLSGDTLFGNGGRLMTASVSGNDLTTTVSPTGVQTQAIRMLFGASGAFSTQGQIRLLAVNNNSIYYANPSDERCDGIYFDYSFADINGQGMNLQFEGNQMRNITGIGLGVRMISARTVNAQNEVTGLSYVTNLSISNNQLHRNSDALEWVLSDPANQPANLNLCLLNISLDNFQFCQNTSECLRSNSNVRNLAFSTSYGGATDFAGNTYKSYNFIIQANIARAGSNTQTIDALWGQFAGAIVTANAKPNNILISSNYYAVNNTTAANEWEGGSNWYDPATNDINVSTKGL